MSSLPYLLSSLSYLLPSLQHGHVVRLVLDEGTVGAGGPVAGHHLGGEDCTALDWTMVATVVATKYKYNRYLNKFGKTCTRPTAGSGQGLNCHVNG